MDDDPQSIAPLVERFAEDLADGIPDAPWPPVYPKMPNEAPRVSPSQREEGAGVTDAIREPSRRPNVPDPASCEPTQSSKEPQ